MRHSARPSRPPAAPPDESAVVRAAATIRPRDFQTATAHVSWSDLCVHGVEVRLPQGQPSQGDDH